MLLVLASVGLLGVVAYSSMGSTTVKSVSGSSVTDALNKEIDNGYRFRDVTYTDKIDLSHPDVKNNSFFFQQSLAQDRGNNGIPRQYIQLYPGSSEITQFSIRENLYV